MITLHDGGNTDDDTRLLATRICHDTGVELQLFLPTLPSDVTVSLSLGSRVIPGLGYGASALDRHTVSFVVSPTDWHIVRRTLEEHLRHTLFHECHHLVRGWVKYGGLPRRFFIDGVVCEGLASVFERDATGYTLPWCIYPDEVRDWVGELLSLPLDADYRQWMFRHSDGRQWIGYRAGAYIADCAIQRSGLDAAKLANAPTEQILELAGLPQPRIGRLRT